MFENTIDCWKHTIIEIVDVFWLSGKKQQQQQQ